MCVYGEGGGGRKREGVELLLYLIFCLTTARGMKLRVSSIQLDSNDANIFPVTIID